MIMKNRMWIVLLALVLMLGLFPAVSASADGESYTVMELDKPYSVTFQGEGEYLWFQFTAPGTGYYTISTSGEIDASILVTYITFNDGSGWYSQNPTVTGSFQVFMLKGQTYTFGANTVTPYWDEDHYTGYTYIGDEEKRVAYTMTLSYAGFNDFISGCPSWNISTAPEAEITLDAVYAGRYFKPVEVTADADGYYRLTMKSDAAKTWPVLLSADGSMLTDLYGNAETTGIIGAYFSAGDTYYLIPAQLIEAGEQTLSVTAEENDLSYYCIDGFKHEYDTELVKATFDAAGFYGEVCPVCGAEGEGSSIPQVNYVGLEKTKYTYTGEAIEPAVTLSVGGTVWNSGYTVEYADNVSPGTATATVTLTEDWYEGSKTLEFSIVSDGTADERADIEKIDLSGVVTPVDGETPDDWEINGIQTSGHYFVSDLIWVAEEDWENAYASTEGLSAEDVFEKDKTYVLRMEIEAEDGYRFYSDDYSEILASVQINYDEEEDLVDLEKLDYDIYEDNDKDVKSVIIVCKYVCEASGDDPSDPGEESDGIPITAVSLALTAPKAGTTSKTALGITVPSGNHYSVEWTGWYGPAPDYVMPDLYDGEYTFEAGGTYRAAITLKADDGYDFSDAVTAAVTGGGSLIGITDIYNNPQSGYSAMVLDVEVSPQAISVTGVKLNKTSLSLNVKGTATLTATVAPTNATNKKVTWTTSNSKVATVSNGKVTAVAAGTANITVKTADGSKTAVCKVTVTVPVTGVKLNKTSLTLSPKGTATLTATVSPTNAANKAVTWTSANKKIATVTSAGKITAVSYGKTTITATTKDGSKKAACTVWVLFKDVPLTNQYKDGVYWAASEGVAAGYSGSRAGIFGVNDGVTRGQFVMFLWRLAGQPAPKKKTQTFKDVPTSHSFYKAIQWASEQGIAAGYSGSKAGYFGPNDSVTRGQTLMFIWRYAGKPAPKKKTQTFKDVATSHNFYKPIQWAAEKGSAKADKNGYFRVNDNCTRGECVSFMYDLLK